MMVTVCLDVKEWRALLEIVEEYSWEKTPEELLESFVHDLTGFPGDGGSDEREFARAWMQRRYGPPFIVREYRKQVGLRVREDSCLGLELRRLAEEQERKGGDA